MAGHVYGGHRGPAPQSKANKDTAQGGARSQAPRLLKGLLMDKLMDRLTFFQDILNLDSLTRWGDGLLRGLLLRY